MVVVVVVVVVGCDIVTGCGTRVSGAGNAYICVGEGREGG